MKWIYVIILEKSSYVPYIYTRINNNQMQRELYDNMFGVVYTVFQLQPFEGSCDADVAHSENEFDSPALV